MKRKYIAISVAIAAVCVGITACVTADEEKEETVSLSQVPQPVKDTLKQYAAESEVKTVEKGDDDGIKVYEFEIQQGAHKFEVAITTDGKYNGTEEDMELSAMPDAAQKALQAQAGGGKISGCEKAMDANNKVTYEADIKKDGKKFEVAVDANGNVVNTESADKEDGKKEKDDKD
jgi:hypothetical protein